MELGRSAAAPDGPSLRPVDPVAAESLERILDAGLRVAVGRLHPGA